jgi:hypothetical protein
VIDLGKFESKGIFLEGTGSIVFDYSNRIAYANISPRTDRLMFEQLSRQLGFTPVSFKAVDQAGADIYHTNVLLCIGKGFVIFCSECVPESPDLEKLYASFRANAQEIIEISREQMNCFAGNMYQLFNFKGESYILMSDQAFRSLRAEQISQLEQYGQLLHPNLGTIERYGGGSARCMIAEIR